ncbi:MAG TPA: hypothetical protein VF017_15280 [Thermoanaerobaculia bacterium]|nr:hypothetical protein [Thermoanaerobaculia bacterium]
MKARALVAALLLGALLGPAAAPALAQGEAAASTGDREQALDVLRRAASALSALSSVRYRARIVPRGIGERFWPAAEGVAVLSGWDAALHRPARFFFDLETRRAGAAQASRISGGGNGETYFVVDHAAKKSYHDMDPLVLGSHGQTLARFEMDEFVMEHPLADELAAREVSYLGIRVRNGREHHEIHVQYSAGRGEATWLFATDDLLPRWRIQKFSIPQGEGSLEIDIVELEIDPDLPASVFDLQLPAGYQAVDDFAP